MNSHVVKIADAIARKDPNALANCLNYQHQDVLNLVARVGRTDRKSLEVYKGSLATPWDEVIMALIQVTVHLQSNVKDLSKRTPNYSDAYREYAHLVNQFFRFFITQTVWVLPTLDKLLRELRTLAAEADLEAQRRDEKTDALEDAARICNKAFTNCLTDRTPLRVNGQKSSRKWGTYRAVGITLKSYIKADKLGLHKSLLRSLTVQTDMPAFDQFDKADQVTCKYYFGLLAFLNEDWGKAREEFTYALRLCHRKATRNRELILSHLIPLHMQRGSLSSPALLAQFPRLNELYTPFILAIKRGDIRKFDEAMKWAEVRMVGMGVWGAVERSREVCVRGFLKEVWKASGKPTRLPIKNILIALKFTDALTSPDPGLDDDDMDVDSESKDPNAKPESKLTPEQRREKAIQDSQLDEAECVSANMIFRGFAKGYISHERRTMVLSAKDPFPKFSNLNL